MATLKFETSEVRKLVDHAKASPQHSATFANLLDKRFAKAGAVPNAHGLYKSHDMDLTKIPAALILVKDSGIYLMSNGVPDLPGTSNRRSANMAIANEAKKSAALIEFEASRVNRDSYLPALSDAIQREQLDVAAEIIASGADVDEYAKWPALEAGMAPIHFANTPEAVELLANAKANINAPYKGVDRAWGMRGETALHTAVLGGKETDLRLAQALIKAGADKTIPFASEYKYTKSSNLGEDSRITRGNLSISDRINTITGCVQVPRVMLVSKLLLGGGGGHDHGYGSNHKHDAPPQEDSPAAEVEAPAP